MLEEKNRDQRDKISEVGLKRDRQEFSEALTTDLKKINANKFFFNLEGEKDRGSQD